MRARLGRSRRASSLTTARRDAKRRAGRARPTETRRIVPDLIIAGPAPAPLLRAETFYRYQIMLRTRAMSKLSQPLAKITGTLALPDDVTLSVDIDPVNLG